MSVVLRPIELAPGKAASIVDDHGIVRNQMFRHPSETVGCASGSRNHEHHRAAAVGLIIETSARNFEDTRLDPPAHFCLDVDTHQILPFKFPEYLANSHYTDDGR